MRVLRNQKKKQLFSFAFKVTLSFPGLGSNVSYKLGYFSNYRPKFLSNFLKHAKRLQFLKAGYFSNFMLWAFSAAWYLKGICSFGEQLKTYNP